MFIQQKPRSALQIVAPSIVSLRGRSMPLYVRVVIERMGATRQLSMRQLCPRVRLQVHGWVGWMATGIGLQPWRQGAAAWFGDEPGSNLKQEAGSWGGWRRSSRIWAYRAVSLCLNGYPDRLRPERTADVPDFLGMLGQVALSGVSVNWSL